jgi:Fe-S oxidoreductase
VREEASRFYRCSGRVWIFHGSLDRVVPPDVTQAVADLYRDLGLGADALRIEDDPASGETALRNEYPSQEEAKEMARSIARLSREAPQVQPEE